jgi:small subunit ribosomal protein S18
MTKDCYFCQERIKEIDYQNTDLLRRFISSHAKILPPKRTGTCAKHQRRLAKAIKRARIMGLLPFTTK